MKKLKHISFTWGLPRMIINYLSNHAASIRAMEAEYFSTPDEAEASATIRITIAPCGHMYRVTQAFYQHGLLSREQTWLATYGWQCNGHLIAIGSHRYLIFDPPNDLLYLEEWLDTPAEVVTIYKQQKENI